MAINNTNIIVNLLNLARENKATSSTINEAVSRMSNKEIGVALVAISTRFGGEDDIRAQIAALVLLEAAERFGFKKE
jgi:hypothetical protein